MVGPTLTKSLKQFHALCENNPPAFMIDFCYIYMGLNGVKSAEICIRLFYLDVNTQTPCQFSGAVTISSPHFLE